MNKTLLVKKIIAHLTDKVALHVGAAKAAHVEATHEESKAEDKYDTRGLEASYLAAGQSKQLEEMADALQQFARMTVRKFQPTEAIDLSALVELETNEGRSLYFMGPSGGGTDVVHERKAVLVITPQSPLGRQLVGRKKGDRLKMKIGGSMNDYSVVSVA
ncbi:MAG: transcription elongation factor GreAB [bacterium]